MPWDRSPRIKYLLALKNLLLTKGKGRIEKYWPEFEQVRAERSEVGVKTDGANIPQDGSTKLG